MPENYFGEFVDAVSRFRDEEIVEQSRRIRERELGNRALREEQETLASMNEARRATHEGHTPEELWGSEVAALCADFIEFAVQASGSRRNLIGAKYLRGDVPVETYMAEEPRGLFRWETVSKTRVTGIGWRSSGYPIAYTNPKGYRKSESSRSNKPPQFDMPEPEPDVLLCRDGLIRRGTGPLDIINLAGDVRVPKVTRWQTYTETISGRDSYEGAYDTEYYTSYTHYEQMSFVEVDPLEGLKSILENYALYIRQGQLEGWPDGR